MSTTKINATGIKPDMTLLLDGQHHIVDDVERQEDGTIRVEAETIVGNMSHRTFWLNPTHIVTVIGVHNESTVV